MKPYKSYHFKGKDPIIGKLNVIVQGSGEKYKKISDTSGVSTTAIRGWFRGKTRRPQFATVNAVAMALGHELKLNKR